MYLTFSPQVCPAVLVLHACVQRVRTTGVCACILMFGMHAYAYTTLYSASEWWGREDSGAYTFTYGRGLWQEGSSCAKPVRGDPANRLLE